MKELDMSNLSLKNLAALVSKKLEEHEIESVLVGGGCVSIYSNNQYQSYDLDFVTFDNLKKVEVALKELGFEKDGRRFVHKKCPFYVEFVSPPVAIGEEPISKYENYKLPLGTIKMLTPTDSVKDRLASYYHWNDRQSLDQAIAICKEQGRRIDMKAVKTWSQNEGFLDQFEFFYERLVKHNCD